MNFLKYPCLILHKLELCLKESVLCDKILELPVSIDVVYYFCSFI